MFSTNHFIWMALCAVFIGVMLFFSVKFKFSFQLSTRIVLAISVACELLKIFTHIEESENGGVLDTEALPLHLCTMLIFIILYITLTKNENRREKLVSFCFPIALWGGVLAILMATSGVNFLKPYAYQCFVFHAALIWWALYLLITKQVNLRFNAYVNNLVCLACLLIVMIWVNSALSVYDANFFFIVRPPMDGLPILTLDNGWYAYFATLVIIGITLITLTHLPCMIKEFKEKVVAKKQTERKE